MEEERHIFTLIFCTSFSGSDDFAHEKETDLFTNVLCHIPIFCTSLVGDTATNLIKYICLIFYPKSASGTALSTAGGRSARVRTELRLNTCLLRVDV